MAKRRKKLIKKLTERLEGIQTDVCAAKTLHLRGRDVDVQLGMGALLDRSVEDLDELLECIEEYVT